ncbi:myb/SANT-like DNA-binding domain-containing protein 2 [Malaclemys terrapin pileata]|uniref:myb/SANT-like DNA-binding domain-containing protein 2 n=1 Tax=Malaclemys terrapin pileata TaxID=2991368 RepID=UPI0023A86B14|nr:myb/SANT-like DNA-binding domain-containing protein 2 [Malaclemys terrapin pileata]
MTEIGYSRDTKQCQTKIKELRQVYQKAREANRRSGSQTHTFCFYHEPHAVMGGDATTTPPLSVDTCKGGVARNEEEESLEDKEEEDSAQAASGECVFPPSQELFLTLESIASPTLKVGSRTMTLEQVLLVQMFQRGPYLLHPRGWSRLEGGKNELGTTCSPSSCSPLALIGPS